MLKKFIKKVVELAAISIVALSFISCLSVPESEDIPVITKHDDCMLWEINGKDKNGEPSKLYVVGTINVGDDRMKSVYEKVIKYYNNSDRYYTELSFDELEKSQEMLAALFEESPRIEHENSQASGKILFEELTEDENVWLMMNLGLTTLYIGENEPWVGYYLLKSSAVGNLSFENPNGIFPLLYNTYLVEKKDFKGIETAEEQMKIFRHHTREEQIAMMKHYINKSIEEPEYYLNMINGLYEAYLAGDIKTFEKLIYQNGIPEDVLEYNFYKDVERNKIYAQKFTDILNEGGTTFMFADMTRFIGKKSVFEMMKQNGKLR